MLGGGMRQVGVLAAAGLYALDHNVERLADDHENARLLARGLADTPGIAIDIERVQSNIVKFDIAGTGMTAAEFCAALTELGVRVAGGGTTIRAVTSLEVTRPDIEYAIEAVRRVARRPAPAAV
jgi:threonine aldolase